MKADLIIPAFGDKTLQRCLQSVAEQKLSCHEISSVIIVDDGSNPPIRVCGGHAGLPLFLRRNSMNLGRSASRNIGASTGSGSAVIFLDADLLLSTPDSLQVLLDRLKEDEMVVMGRIIRNYPSFWAWYETRSVSRKLVESGPNWAGTTAFVALYRKAFDQLGGFDTNFTAYGFEDRDFLYRAFLAGLPIVRAAEAIAEHDGDSSAVRVARKLHAAGRSSAQRFRTKHPNAYRQLPYAMIDLSDAPAILRCITVRVYKAALRGAVLAARFHDRNRLPFWLRGITVRFLSALAFAAGTAQSRSLARQNSRGGARR